MNGGGKPCYCSSNRAQESGIIIKQFKENKHLLTSSMLTFNRCGFNFLPYKAVSSNIIYRYKYVISFTDVGIKLSNIEVVVTRIPKWKISTEHTRMPTQCMTYPQRCFRWGLVCHFTQTVTGFWILKSLHHTAENNSCKCKIYPIIFPKWSWWCRSAVRKFKTLFWSSIHWTKNKIQKSKQAVPKNKQNTATKLITQDVKAHN
jgi:hypothetical protein